MSRISAEQNLTIEIEADRWRLLANGDGPEHVLVEAASGEPLRYLPLFASKRHLPETGVLPVDRVQRVVVGWSTKDASWHLGLMLEPELAEARGSRWCEMARWIDPDRSRYGTDATEAGTRLAETMTRPFNLIPPRDDDDLSSRAATMPVSAYGAATAPHLSYVEPLPTLAAREVIQRELPPLPIHLDQWTLEPGDDQMLQLRLSGAWARGRLLRAVWYTFWAVVYIVLSVLTLRGGIALPRPEFLPYLGLAAAAVLVLLILSIFVQMLARTNRIVFDGVTRTIRGLHGSGERWHIAPDDLESIYVSQVVSRRAKGDKRTVHHGELNVLCRDGHFVYLLANLQTEVKDVTLDATPLEDGVMPLTPNLVYTDVQAAGAHMARVLNVPCWFDQRLR